MKDSKKTFIRALILSGISSIILPIFIHIAFKLESPEGSFLTAKWEAGDILSYCGSIIGSVIVVITVWYTLKTSNYESRKTIEASQRQFSIDMAMNTFMEYVDTVSYDRVKKCFQYNDDINNSQISKLKLEKDEINDLSVSICLNRDKTYFFLSKDEERYLSRNTPKVQDTLTLLGNINESLGEIISLKTKYQYKQINENEFEKQFYPQSKKYDELFGNILLTIIAAHSELLTSLKILINNRLDINNENKNPQNLSNI